MVEFTLIFLLLLVITWIPAEFGLAFYAGQVAQNAAREGARIAAADPNPVAGTCGPPLSNCYTGANILKETSLRLPAALLSGVTVSLAVDTPSTTDCNEKVTVTVTGQYRFFFYQLFKLMGASISDTKQITRSTAMRWENQPPCPPIP